MFGTSQQSARQAKNCISHGWPAQCPHRQMKAKALMVVQRLMNSALVGCCERWLDQTSEEKQMKAKALKVVQRLINSALVGCFERWH